jgi:Arc/MetJ-type ribon-helix-helix transcriptional regulator
LRAKAYLQKYALFTCPNGYIKIVRATCRPIIYKLVLTNKKYMGIDVGITGNIGNVVGAKLIQNEISQINKLIEAGFYLNPSDFIREAFREKLAAIKVIEYRDVDYETAKKEVAGYFQMKGEAYASDASTYLQLDYELVCKIMDDLETEGKMETTE